MRNTPFLIGLFDWSIPWWHLNSRPTRGLPHGYGLERKSPVLVLSLVASFAGPTMAQDADVGGQAFDCLIQPELLLELGTSVPGLIAEVLVDRGVSVSKGDVIARLESGVEAAAVSLAEARAKNETSVRSAEAKVEFQQRKRDRASELSKKDTIAEAVADEAETAARVAEIELDEAKLNLQLAQLELARAREILEQRTIRSPIDGIVVSRTLGPGEYAFDQAHLVTVAQIDPLKVEVFVPVDFYGKIRPGAPAEVYPEYPAGSRYAATVTVVDQVFDAASATVGVRLELPNPGHRLPAGLKCKVRFAGEG